MIIEFSKEVALLLALSFLYGFIARRWANEELTGRVLAGFLFGGVCVIGMSAPIQIAPGVIFDARSVVLSMAGLFGGPVAGGIAAAIAGGYRAWLGGTGATVGVAVVVACVGLGVAYRCCHQRAWLRIGLPQLLVFGFLVHVVVVGLFLFLPADIVRKVMDNIALPFILAFTPGTALLGILLRSIETQIQTEQSLLKGEHHYRSLIENSQLGIRIEKPGAELLFANDACAQMFGFQDSREYMAACSEPGKYIAPYDRDRILANMAARKEGKEALNEYEYDALKKDRSVLSVHVFVREVVWNGEPALHRTLLDISKRRTAENKLRESEERFRAFFDNSPSHLFAKDSGHNMVFVNAKYLDFHGVSEADVVGKRGGKTLSKEKRAELEALEDKVMSDGTISTGEIPMTSKSGDTREFFIIKFPIFGAAGEITGIGSINTDVTELNKREKQLAAAKQEAEELAKKAEAASESKSQFLATMSHEIRTPMNGVLGMTEVLADTDLTAEQRDIVKTIKDSGAALLGLLNDILDLSKIEAGRFELESNTVSISECLDSADKLWAHSAREKGLEFSIRNNLTDTDAVLSDRARFRQVLNNLIGNAIKFTSDGSIEVCAEASPRADGRVTLRLEVRDTGIGLSDAQKNKLFQPFTQADSSTTRQFGGTGLGLSISKELVELLGGEIGVQSIHGKGSTFWFSIPVERADVRDNGDAPAVAKAAETTETGQQRSLRILVAEDNAINRKVVSWILTGLNHQFDFAENGLEAVAAVARSDYDLVFMDIQMPEMDGKEATRQIRAMTGTKALIPIIAMTANAMQGDREEYLGAGMNDYVSKPLDRKELLGAITRSTGVAMPKIEEAAVSQPLTGGPPAKPLTVVASRELSKMIDGLDDLLDGTDS